MNKTDVHGKHALMFAAENDELWVVTCIEILTEKGADVNRKD